MTAPRMHARNPETGRGTACGRYGVPSVDLNDGPPDALEFVTCKPCLRIITQGHR